MTDSEKLQAILDYAKREMDYAIAQRHIVSSLFYDNNDGTYTYDMVHNAQQTAYERSLFFNTIKQIIEKPNEYIKEQQFIEDCVKRLEATRGNTNDKIGQSNSSI